MSRKWLTQSTMSLNVAYENLYSPHNSDSSSDNINKYKIIQQKY